VPPGWRVSPICPVGRALAIRNAAHDQSPPVYPRRLRIGAIWAPDTSLGVASAG